MQVILYQPEIPQNTGNIVRTCSVTSSSLVLVRPLGFFTSSRHLKRAGLDYWEETEIITIDDLLDFLKHSEKKFFFFSSKAKKNYTEVVYPRNAQLIFGSESQGLPEDFFSKWPEAFVKIPMVEKKRCLNLANAVAIGLYEALRQNGFSTF